jgi:predicted transposase/invertase (TIGR01784 family)
MLRERYINPFTDFGFKRLFGSEPNKDLLIDFLNQILPAHHRIADLTFANNERLGHNELDRKAIFDIYCESQTGERFIVELQKAKQNYFKDRSVYYTTFPIQEQAKKGEWNYQLSAVYLIGILDFVFEEDRNEPDVMHVVQLKDQHNAVFYDKLTYIYLEMPHFNKLEDELESDFDKWLYVIKHLPHLERVPARLQTRLFEKLFGVAEIAKLDRNGLQAYEDSLKAYRDLKNVLDTAFDDGKAEGREEGIISVARNMKAAGMATSDIAKLTGLTPAQIEAL